MKVEIDIDKELEDIESNIFDSCKQIEKYSKINMNKEHMFSTLQSEAEKIVREVAKWRNLKQIKTEMED